MASPEEEDEDLFKLLDEEQDNRQGVSESDTLTASRGGGGENVLDEIDSFLLEDEEDKKAEALLNASKESKSKEDSSSKQESQQPSTSSRSNKQQDLSINDPSYFKPPVQSTPMRAKDSEEEPSAEPDVDYSILYDDDDEDDADLDGFQTVSMEEWAKTLDDSILYTDIEDDLNASANTTAVNKESLDSTLKAENTVVKANLAAATSSSSLTVADPKSTPLVEAKKEVADSTTVDKKPAAPPPHKKAEEDGGSVATIEGMMNMHRKRLLLEKYYDRAYKNWKLTTDFKNGYTIPSFPKGNFDDPKMWKDERSGKMKVEGPDEWADKHHPMWEEFRQKTRDEAKTGAFIHHKWGWNNSVDITRNLTKFSRGRTKTASDHAPSTSTGSGKTAKAVKKAPDTTVDMSDDGLIAADKDVFSVLLKRFEEDENDELVVVDSWNSKSAEGSPQDESPENDDDVAVVDEVKKAACCYCTSICHCSPGRIIKRPYFSVSRDPVIDPMEKEAKRCKIKDVQREVREAINHQLNFGSAPHNHRHYSKAAANVLASTGEAFELALNYRQDPNELPYFSKDQVRELLSVEMTQDKYKSFYKSPYAGHDHSDDEPEEDEDDFDEIEGRPGSPKPKADNNRDQQSPEKAWSRSLLENY